MKKYLEQLHFAMGILRQKLTQDNTEARLALSPRAQQAMELFGAELSARVAEVQKTEAVRIRLELEKMDASAPIHQQKVALLSAINTAGAALKGLYFDLFASSLFLKEGFNGCMEHATLMFLILNKEFLLDPDVLIESMGVYNKLNPMMNHNFLVINRCPGDYPLIDVASWGNECLVVDSWLGVIASPSAMPSGSSIHSFLHGRDICSMRVEYTNRLGMELCVYPQGHLFHQIERDTQQVIHTEFKKIIEQYTEILDLPWFKASTSPAASSATSIHGLFPPVRSDVEETHAQLSLEIKQCCADKYQSVVEAVQGKQYTLALRKASAVGHIELVSILLSYKVLGFDINEPSKTSTNTALDWAIKKGHAETAALIEKHGGKSGSAENDTQKVNKL
ncbi:hypothetical protein ACD661_13395 [Legionella lytica]|uniref:Ankyrin repeat protein n=1 Tax=Legionella lytica TaxID=96232 RepID=A0ABW8DA22_9GAMM